MAKLRKRIARIILTICTPTWVYILWHLTDADYCPSIGWVFGIFVLLGWTAWSIYWAELTHKFSE